MTYPMRPQRSSGGCPSRVTPDWEARRGSFEPCPVQPLLDLIRHISRPLNEHRMGAVFNRFHFHAPTRMGLRRLCQGQNLRCGISSRVSVRRSSHGLPTTARADSRRHNAVVWPWDGGMENGAMTRISAIIYTDLLGNDRFQTAALPALTATLRAMSPRTEPRASGQ